MSQAHLDREQEIKKIISQNQLVLTKVLDYDRYNFRLLIKSRLQPLNLSLKNHFKKSWIENLGHRLIKSVEFSIGNQVVNSREIDPRTGKLVSVPYLGWFGDRSFQE